MNDSSDYISVIYNESDRPRTSYPQKLCSYLYSKYNLDKFTNILDVGSGRGEFLSSFIECGLTGFGVDQSPNAQSYCPNGLVKISDIEIDGIPYPDNYFDVVFSKSVIEHFYRPELMISEVYRVLKPGGVAIIMCPDWYYNYRIYFEDYTHRSPFMKSSLRDLLIISGFQNVSVSHFRQLPILWRSGQFLFFLAELTRIFTPRLLSKYSKWIRFSKEIMLLSYSQKPLQL